MESFSEEQTPSLVSQSQYLEYVNPDLEEVMPQILSNKQRDAQKIQKALQLGKLQEVAAFAHKMRGPHELTGLNDMSRQLEEKVQASDKIASKLLADQIVDYLNTVEIRFEKRNNNESI